MQDNDLSQIYYWLDFHGCAYRCHLRFQADVQIFEGFQKGVNLGGWISQYDEFDFNHFDTFIQESDIKDIASLGFDHVRVPVRQPFPFY